MRELIDRQAAIDVVSGIDSHFVKYIQDIPSIEAKPVIHCKDCRYWEADYFCNNFNVIGFEANDFCSLAKRRTDETD